MISEIVVVAACIVLLVLAVEAVGAMPRSGVWWAFALWASIGTGALLVGATARHMPLPAALLLLAIALLLWRQRRRIVFSLERGKPW